MFAHLFASAKRAYHRGTILPNAITTHTHTQKYLPGNSSCGMDSYRTLDVCVCSVVVVRQQLLCWALGSVIGRQAVSGGNTLASSATIVEMANRGVIDPLSGQAANG